jgi:hypothetical protein
MLSVSPGPTRPLPPRFTKEKNMFLALGIFLLVTWVVVFVLFKVTIFAIHLLIIVALISFIAHLFRGGRGTP